MGEQKGGDWGRGIKFGDYRVLGLLCLLGCCSVVKREGTCVSNCRGIRWMGVMCRAVIIDFSKW
jgi:hypothetical protein